MPGRWQVVVRALLQFTSVLACYYVSPPLELQHLLAIRPEKNKFYTTRRPDAELPANDLFRRQRANQECQASKEIAYTCCRCVSAHR